MRRWVVRHEVRRVQKRFGEGRVNRHGAERRVERALPVQGRAGRTADTRVVGGEDHDGRRQAQPPEHRPDTATGVHSPGMRCDRSATTARVVRHAVETRGDERQEIVRIGRVELAGHCRSPHRAVGSSHELLSITATRRRRAPHAPGCASKTPAHGVPHVRHRLSAVRRQSPQSHTSRARSGSRRRRGSYVVPPSTSCTLPVYAYRTPFRSAIPRARRSVVGRRRRPIAASSSPDETR